MTSLKTQFESVLSNGWTPLGENIYSLDIEWFSLLNKLIIALKIRTIPNLVKVRIVPYEQERYNKR